MQKRIIGFIACALALVISFGATVFKQDELTRYHQHLEATEKQPCDHASDELCTHLPLVQIDTAGKEIPGLPIYDENKKRTYTLTEDGKEELLCDIKISDSQEKRSKLCIMEYSKRNTRICSISIS